MVKINNGEISRSFDEGFITNTTEIGQLSNTSNIVAPTYDYSNNLFCDISKYSSATGGVSTIYTTPTNRDFFLTSAYLDMLKIVTDNGTFCVLQASVNGAIQWLIALTGVTLNADSKNASVVFNPPIKIDRGTNIQCFCNSGTVSQLFGRITGYTRQR